MFLTKFLRFVTVETTHFIFISQVNLKVCGSEKQVKKS